MTKYITFIAGIITGVYISQNYNIPKIKTIYDKILEYEKEYKKK